MATFLHLKPVPLPRATKPGRAESAAEEPIEDALIVEEPAAPAPESAEDPEPAPEPEAPPEPEPEAIPEALAEEPEAPAVQDAPKTPFAPPPPGGPHTLEARDLVKSYKGRTVVRGVSIHVDRGEVVGLLGPNGAGKTTSFYMILGLVRPDRGQIVFQERDLTKFPVYKRARAGLGYLAQEPSIFRKLTVEQNISAILETTDLSREARKKRLDELLERFDLAKVRKQYAYTLSGGERRKLEIARALVQNPAVLMLDEPFAGVDPVAVEGIRSIVRDLRADGIGILITDHNVRETLSIVDRAYILIDGTVIKEGSVDDIVSDPVVRSRYLTEDFRM